MVDSLGNPITAGFSLHPDALGLGSEQLQAVIAMAAPQEAPRPMGVSTFSQPAIQSGPTKLFVGSIPSGTTQEMIKEEFGKYGAVAEVFLKNDNAQDGRMWGFVTFVSPDGSANAVAALNDKIIFPNAQRPLSVSFAKSGGGGGGGAAHAAPAMALPPAGGGAGFGHAGTTKLFLGSIPSGTTREQIIAEFGKFGQVMDVFLKQDNAEPGRMWGFVTYDNAPAAAAAVANLHERLVLPGGSRPCAVSFARNSQAQHSMAAQNLATSAINPVAGATKLFIGTIPMGTTEVSLRVEFEKFGQVTEIFLKNDSTDPNRMWGFLSYAEAQSAAVAVTALHEKLMMPGSTRPLAVSFAKNAGRGGPSGQTQASSVLGLSPPLGIDTSSSPWKVYYTAQGLPYYHNSLTGVTTWDCPPEFPGGPAAVLTDPASAAHLLAAAGGAQTRAVAETPSNNTFGLDNSSPVLGFTQVASISDSQRYSPF